MICPHDSHTKGHYSTVTYTPVDGEVGVVFPRKPAKKVTQAYWFCHSCARIVYDDEQHFTKQEQK